MNEVVAQTIRYVSNSAQPEGLSKKGFIENIDAKPAAAEFLEHANDELASMLHGMES